MCFEPFAKPSQLRKYNITVNDLVTHKNIPDDMNVTKMFDDTFYVLNKDFQIYIESEINDWEDIFLEEDSQVILCKHSGIVSNKLILEYFILGWILLHPGIFIT